MAKFEPPKPGPARPTTCLTAADWPFTPEQAAERQRQAGAADLLLDLGEGVTMKLRAIPAGRFVMGDIHGAPDEWTQTAVEIQNRSTWANSR